MAGISRWNDIYMCKVSYTSCEIIWYYIQGVSRADRYGVSLRYSVSFRSSCCLRFMQMLQLFFTSIPRYSVNYIRGPMENRLLLTGLHTIADIHCVACDAIYSCIYIYLYITYVAVVLYVILYCVFFHTHKWWRGTRCSFTPSWNITSHEASE